jgi:hypothetical protein
MADKVIDKLNELLAMDSGAISLLFAAEVNGEAFLEVPNTPVNAGAVGPYLVGLRPLGLINAILSEIEPNHVPVAMVITDDRTTITAFTRRSNV